MAIKYLYIDDETKAKAEGISKPLNADHDILVVEHEQPLTWNAQVKKLIEDRKINNYDGLLLDLKLEFSSGDENDVKYYGSDLAQNLRTEVKAGNISDLPILLCSTDENLAAFFDKTSVDLFDKKYRKNKDLSSPNTVNEFVAFANCYKVLNVNRPLKETLASSNNLDDDLVAVQFTYDSYKTSHERSIFIYHALILSPGLLIDEELLAIRLGIAKDQSEDWQTLKSTFLKGFAYKGVLSSAFPRWWQKDLITWWKEKFGKSLKVQTSNEKVELLKQFFGLQRLLPIELPPHHLYSTFWYKCRLSDYPLESADGIKTLEQPKHIWQEPTYISMAYIMSEERNSRNIKALLGAQELKLFDELTEKN